MQLELKEQFVQERKVMHIFVYVVDIQVSAVCATEGFFKKRDKNRKERSRDEFVFALEAFCFGQKGFCIRPLFEKVST